VSDLMVVMPVYNEERALPSVVGEWMAALEAIVGDFHLLCLDDGSDDATPAVLQALQQQHPRLLVQRGPNRGHGPTCLQGYRIALESEASWILQIDSDGQCESACFGDFWARRSNSCSLYGYRWPRQDGLHRSLFSRLLSLLVWARTRTWVGDANVPFRLLHRQGLAACLGSIAADFHLANVALAVLQARRGEIAWRRVPFRQRFAGASKQSWSGLPRRAVQLWRQLGELSSSSS